jgi:molybdopterin synthase sulfur carrier subunit
MPLRLDGPATGGTLTVRCRLLARYAEVIGQGEVTLELPRPSTVLDAIRFLRARVPNGALLPERPLVAVNLEHALSTAQLNDGDELALLPPIAGG